MQIQKGGKMKKVILLLLMILYSCAITMPGGVYVGTIQKMYKSTLFNTSWFIELRTFDQKLEKLRTDKETDNKIIQELINATLRGKIVEIEYKERKMWDLQKIIKQVRLYE